MAREYGLPGDIPVVGRWLPGDRRARITGVKWNDLDNDGVRDLNEPGIPNLKVFLDNDDDGVRDAGEISTTTTVDDPGTAQDEAGFFVFEGLRPGTYFVNSERGPSFEQTFPSAAGEFSRGQNAAVANEEFARAADAQARALNASATDNSNIPPFNADGQQVENDHLAQINLDGLLAKQDFTHLDGAGYSIVVIDTGLVPTDGFFGDRVVENIDLFDADGINPLDINGHGVHVTSIAASSDGTHGGVAPGANIIHLKIFPDDPGQSSNELVLEKALNWVVNHAATLNIAAVNMSLAAGNFASGTSSHALADELASLAALRIIPVGAAGNSFTAAQPGIAFPASDPNVVSVGAVDSNDMIASFSQRQDQLLDILAPGVDITGAGLDGGTAVLRGTSQASPQVAGAAVLAQQLADEHLGRRLTVAEFVEVIQASDVIVQDPILKHQNGKPFEYRRLDMLAMAEAILDIAPTNGHGAYKVKVAASDSVDVEFGDIDLSSVPDPTGKISGRLYHDTNGNMNFDAGEAALQGWTVFLDRDGDKEFDASDEPFRVSAADGSFELSELDADHYTVHATAPADGQAWTLTNPLEIGSESQLIFGDDEPSDVAIGDLNQDGKPDVVVTAAAGNVVNVFLTGSGTTRVQSESFVRPDRVLITHANGDAFPDLLITNSFDGRATLLLNDPSLGFDAITPRIIEIGGSQTSLAAGDFNQDGIEDIVVVHDTLGNAGVSILLNDGSGNYDTGQNAIEITSAPYATDVLVADFNDDGKDDIAVATFGTGIGNGEVIVLLNTAPTNRRPRLADFARQTYNTGFNIGALAAANLDDDNDVDLVAVNSSTQSLTRLTFDGQVFIQSAIDNIGPDLVDVAADDVNRDGRVDLVVASGRGGAVYILTQTTSGAFNSPVRLDVAGQFELSENSRLAVGDIRGGDLPELVVTIPAKDRLAIATLTEVTGPHRVQLATADAVVQDLEFGARIENFPPTLNGLGSVVVQEDPGNPVVVALTGIGDGNGGLQDLTFSVMSSNQSLIPANAISAISWDGGSDGSFTFTPAPDKHGAADLVVTVRDNGGTVNADVDTITQTVHVTVNAVNDPPVAHSQTIVVTEDTERAIVLSGSDVEESNLAYTFVKFPIHGVLTGTAPNLVYHPDTHFDETDSFTFSVYDGELDSESVATVTIEFVAVNDQPVAHSQNLTTAEDTDLDILLTGSDVEGSAITYHIIEQPAHGMLTGTAPNVVYSPFANSVVNDRFTFRVSDGELNSAAATIAIRVDGVNDSPTALDASSDTDEDTPVTLLLPVADLDGLDTLELELAADGVLGSAAVVKTAQGFELTYDPSRSLQLQEMSQGETANQSIRYTVMDSSGATATGTLTVTVHGSNDWLNPTDQADVNNNGSVEPLDVLLIINSLNAVGSRVLVGLIGRPERFYDVNGDNAISPIDALIIINRLNRIVGAEGESRPIIAPFGVKDIVVQSANADQRLVERESAELSKFTNGAFVPDLRASERQLNRQVVDEEWARWSDELSELLEDAIDDLLGG